MQELRPVVVALELSAVQLRRAEVQVLKRMEPSSMSDAVRMCQEIAALESVVWQEACW